MFQAVKLLLPALVPSWRFFDVIAPSPRIEFAVLDNENAAPKDWREFRPRPDGLSLFAMIKRMVWNPHWNESLFLMSCAERIVAGQEEHSRCEIIQRIRHDLEGNAAYFQFRLVFIAREGQVLEKHVAYLSPIEPIDSGVQL